MSIYENNIYSPYKGVQSSSSVGSSEAPSKEEQKEAEEAAEFYNLLSEIYLLMHAYPNDRVSLEKLEEKLRNFIKNNPELEKYVGGPGAIAAAEKFMDDASHGMASQEIQDFTDLEQYLESTMSTYQDTFTYMLTHMGSGGIPNFSAEEKALLGNIATIMLAAMIQGGPLGKDLGRKFFGDPDAVFTNGVFAQVLIDHLANELPDSYMLAISMISSLSNWDLSNVPGNVQDIIHDFENTSPFDPKPENNPFDYEQIRKAAQNALQG